MKLLEPVIGLEIHLQLKTKSKMFCACPNQEAAAPNSFICPVCTGQPGSLPVPNEQAVRWCILAGLALNCHINPSTKFDRKHYFYPDLPKGYQISQFDVPIAEHGEFQIITGGGIRESAVIGITRVHLEEDAAKSFHGEEGKTFVDFNRAGSPLIEIVTEPDFRSAREAKVFLQELRLLGRALGVSNAEMEKGEMRCDVNVSMREIDKNGLFVGSEFHPKTEVKNVNSFKAVERVIEFEIQRQSKLWQMSSPPAVSSTRGWNDDKQATEEQRTKEDSGDYRYFPEPDIPALDLQAMIKEIKPTLPELPAARRRRFVDEYNLSYENAKYLCDDQRLADFSEAMFSELFSWMETVPELETATEEVLEKEKHRLSKLAVGWLVSKYGGLLADKNISFEEQKISPENFAEFIILIAKGRLSTGNGLQVLQKMMDTGADPEHLIEEHNLNLVADESAISGVVKKIMDENPNEAARFRAGEIKLLKFFLGQIMKETGGKADPNVAKMILEQELGE
ncbi:MAG: Aspartyl/glutamyl-tRNA(Asn/Gln) amidotransferase subunit B [Candidatus Uhrbacteria bacterium GW2011_GWE2_45_35]|uniref:Aspartyl/glutamyl-tRNA(Asn/Gln) amidotransferase subunit B n=1 Tax=Candidatus Uhrbacteria bacterium GW2011_GWE2_45_35 TaxID=1618993 RepID=A0A0G1MF57_9BACT|nr:MAG: Aspartyl/glutamyl-tRNA(Asn/Gln) amidotransferase subunit B [Candidatus Uhrbacteria bacterium GW2011_GWE2_45_35]HBR80977.1 Asp-tRNA(Asn)/Glu-tRNA(Gln) amidotransferase subunit GatB [Candidatus Uhrbacteria bacterium]HCU31926.1 Asp-tRNA(Asn)/Glu-tRNA(Gln) amidotransferase subunit GatB [Candidatus Uhrbacteria bacterium]